MIQSDLLICHFYGYYFHAPSKGLEKLVDSVEKYQQLISEKGFTVIAVDVFEIIKENLFEVISTEVKNDLTSKIETSLESILK